MQRQRRVHARLVHGGHKDSEAKTHLEILSHDDLFDRAVRTTLAS